LTLQVPFSGMQAPPVVVEMFAGLQAVPLFWLLPQPLPTSQSAFTEQLVVFGLPAEHLPGTAVHCASAVQESARFVQAPDFLHCAVDPTAVQVALSLPAGQVPTSWQAALFALSTAQLLLNVAPGFVHLPTVVQIAAVMQALPKLFEFVHVPVKSQSVFTLHAWPSFLLFAQVFGPTAGQFALELQLTA
jgi:hypothetical protein